MNLAVDMDKYNKEKQELIEHSNSLHFSQDMVLQPKALVAERKLQKLREEMLAKDDTCCTGHFWDKLPSLLASPLYECLNKMPKPAVHHIHLTASAHVDFLVEKLLYYDFVYFNEKEQNFKVSKNGVKDEGYVKVDTLRQFWESSTSFDQHMRETILLK